MKLLRAWRLPTACVFATLLLVLCGCSKMRFANLPETTEEDDPREDVRMVNVVTDITSGSERLQRIHSREASFSELHGLLKFGDVRLEMFRQGRRQGLTRADKAIVFLSEQRAEGDANEKRGKNDIEFRDRVVHSVLSKDDPTTAASRLETSQLLWDATERKFRKKIKDEQAFVMTLSAPGKPPLRMVGDRFDISEDLRTWVVAGGALTSEMQGDKRKDTLALGDQLTKRVESQPESKPIPKTDLEAPDAVQKPVFRQGTTTGSRTRSPSFAIPL